MVIALGDRLKREIDARERIMAFVPEYAAYMLNRQKKGEDGMVAYERSKGKKPSTVAIEFGEKLLYMKKTRG